MSRFSLPQLPYAYNALEPYISAETLKFHHAKHQAGYVEKLNALVAGTGLESMDLLNLIRKIQGDPEKEKIFNNAAQSWNHTFYWHSMAAGGGGLPQGAVLDLIIQSFGSFERFSDLFQSFGMDQFGSGWVWLILKNNLLEVVKTQNAETPATDVDCTPLLVCDLWEHAYYLEYRNKRAEYLKVFMDSLVDWNAAERRLKNKG